MKQLLSARGAARRLDKSQETIMRWVRLGKLVPIGQVESGLVVFDPEYIDQFRTQPPPEPVALVAAPEPAA